MGFARHKIVLVILALTCGSATGCRATMQNSSSSAVAGVAGVDAPRLRIIVAPVGCAELRAEDIAVVESTEGSWLKERLPCQEWLGLRIVHRESFPGSTAEHLGFRVGDVLMGASVGDIDFPFTVPREKTAWENAVRDALAQDAAPGQGLVGPVPFTLRLLKGWFTPTRGHPPQRTISGRIFRSTTLKDPADAGTFYIFELNAE